VRFTIQTSRMNDINRMLSCLVEDASITVDPSGWSIKAVDEAHVAMLVLKIRKSAFTEYEAVNEEISLDVKRLKKMLPHLKGSDILSIEGSGSRLRFKGGPLAWTMKLNDIEDSSVKVPPVEYAASCELPIDDLRIATKAASDVSNIVSLAIKGRDFTLLAQGDTDDVELHLPIDPTDNAECIYPLDYFHNCVSALPSGKLDLSFADDRPVVLSMVAWDGGLDAKYLIAPCVEGGA